MEIAQHISDLLYKHNCVIIPDFGGIIANYASASISPRQDRILPPSKSLAFNKNLKTNDGLLVNHIVRAEGIAYEQALQRVKQFVEQCVSQLNQKEKVVLGEVGTLKLDIEENLQFEPFSELNYLTDAFGLPKITVSPIIRKTTLAGKELVHESTTVPLITKQQEQQKSKPKKKSEDRKSRHIFLKVVAAVLTVVMLLQIYIQRDDLSKLFLEANGDRAMVGLDTSEIWSSNDAIANDSAPEPSTANAPATDSYPDTNTDEPAIAMVETPDSDPEPSTSEPAPDITPAPTPTTKANANNWYVIVGAFKSRRNAEKMIQKLDRQGYNSGQVIEGENGYYRVGISYTSRPAARSRLSSIRNTVNEGAWILEH